MCRIACEDEERDREKYKAKMGRNHTVHGRFMEVRQKVIKKLKACRGRLPTRVGAAGRGQHCTRCLSFSTHTRWIFVGFSGGLENV